MGQGIHRLRAALAVALIAVAGPAAALGLGQIQVKSKVDQPLLAEIPIISSDPAELEQLQARLASPDTFRRIGLEPPSGATELTSSTKFSLPAESWYRLVRSSRKALSTAGLRMPGWMILRSSSSA